jgi:hypothetical protein
MLTRCCIMIIVMVDTIYFASSWNSPKFSLTFGTIHHVLMQHLDFYSDHAKLFPAKVLGGVRNYCTPSPLRCALIIKALLEVELLCSVI